MKLSLFHHVARIRTPTLILCGQDDWNAPLINSEQLYQALRRLGVPAELVIYPGKARDQAPELPEGSVRTYISSYDEHVKGQPVSSTSTR